MRTLFLMLIVLCSARLPGQRFDPLHPPNTFRNADNPHYWKNAPPYAGYWQQDVHYRIKLRLDEGTDIGTGQLSLTYWNNSPDTLREVFFHLYQNAYDSGSYLQDLEEGQGGWHDFSAERRRGTDVLSMRVDGAELEREVDNTILRAQLKNPLPPQGRVIFEVEFRTFWGGDDRRMKLFNAWGYKHYDGTHWYPRISVYDRKFGWDTQQHLGSEFYGDFGAYDVELDMPNDQVLEATGWLQNPQEVMPADLRAKLDIAQLQGQAVERTTPSVIDAIRCRCPQGVEVPRRERARLRLHRRSHLPHRRSAMERHHVHRRGRGTPCERLAERGRLLRQGDPLAQRTVRHVRCIRRWWWPMRAMAWSIPCSRSTAAANPTIVGCSFMRWATTGSSAWWATTRPTAPCSMKASHSSSPAGDSPTSTAIRS